MAAAQFEKTDAGLQGLFEALNNQITNMNQHSNRVVDTLQSIAMNYRATSSSAYQGKANEWNDLYAQVQGHAKTILSDLQQSNAILDAGNDDAQSTAQAWSPGSDSYYNSLAG